MPGVGLGLFLRKCQMKKRTSQYLNLQGDAIMAKKRTRKIIFISLISLIILFSASSMIFVAKTYQSYFPRFDKPKYVGYLQYSDVKDSYNRQAVSFQSGNNSLKGYVYGEGNDKGLVVIAPGRATSVEEYLADALFFVDNGWRVFAFDYTGSFESQGESSKGLPQARIDLLAALEYIKRDSSLKDLPIMLYGHSWGAYAVTAVLNNVNDISAVASLSGFNSPMELFDEQAHHMIGGFAFVEYPFEWAYQTLLFGSDASVTAVDGINRTNTPVMIIHGTMDESITYNGASIIAQRNHITNPNVVYISLSTKNQNDHDRLMKSVAAMEYINQKNSEFNLLSKRYNGNIPDSAKHEFYADVDHFQVSELNSDFMNQINSFFEDSLQN